nr:uncharacterized protein LOC105492794 isoform X2 [Macaca nemestrina]
MPAEDRKLPNCLPKWLHHFAIPPTMRVPVAANPPPEFGIHVLDFSILIEGQNNGLQICKPHQEDHPRNPWRLRNSLRLVHLETQDEDPTWGCQRGLKRQNTREESGATTQRHWENGSRKCPLTCVLHLCPRLPSFWKPCLTTGLPLLWESLLTLQLTVDLYVCRNIILITFVLLQE